MVKERAPTAEERRLWRLATQHDEKLRADDLLPELEPSDTPPTVTAAPITTPVSKTEPTRAPSAALSVLTGRQASRLLKPYAPIEATLDLHGIGKVEAYGQVTNFIRRAQESGLRHVLIITGKGRTGEGILRASLPQWLNEPATRARIGGLAHASSNKGGSGVVHVVLKRKRNSHD